MTLIISLIVLGTLGLNVFRKQLFNWLLYLDIAHVILIGITIFALVVPSQQILASDELYDFSQKNGWHYFIFVSQIVIQCASLIINIILWKQSSQLKKNLVEQKAIPLTEL